MIRYNVWFPANLICVCMYTVSLYILCVCVCIVYVCAWRRQGGSLLLELSQLCLPVCAVVWGLLWLVWIRNHKIFLPECLQLRPAVGQSSMDAISFLLLQLSTEQNEARDANNERDSPQAQSQTQVCYPEKVRCKKYNKSGKYWVSFNNTLDKGKDWG